MGSYSVRPGDLRLLLASPPSRCLTTSVVRFRALTLLTPATGSVTPSQKTRDLKFLYGWRRCALVVNWAMRFSLRSAAGPGEGARRAGVTSRSGRPSAESG